MIVGGGSSRLQEHNKLKRGGPIVQNNLLLIFYCDYAEVENNQNCQKLVILTVLHQET